MVLLSAIVPLSPGLAAPPRSDSDCLSTGGYLWAYSLPIQGSFTHIFSWEAESFLLVGESQTPAGVILSKIDVNGQWAWTQFMDSLTYRKVRARAAPDGNLLLSFVPPFKSESAPLTLEITPDGSIVHQWEANGVAYQEDESLTVWGDGWLGRFVSPKRLSWAVEWPYGATLLQDDGGALGAYVYTYTDTTSMQAPARADIVVVRLTGDGESVARAFGNSLGLENLQVLLDDGFIAGSYLRDFTSAESDIWWAKLSAGGSLRWQYAWVTNNIGEDSFTAIESHPSSGYILAPNTMDDPILRLNGQGAPLFQGFMTTKFGDIDIQAIDGTPNGGALIGGAFRLFQKSGDGIWLARLDPRGKLAWEKILDFRPESRSAGYISDIHTLEDGTFLIIGQTSILGDNADEAVHPWAARLQDEGESGNMLTFEPLSYQSVATFASTNVKDSPQLAPLIIPEIPEAAVSIEMQAVTPQTACLGRVDTEALAEALTALTPTLTPTPAFQRALYLTNPYMSGDDVLQVQQRLIDLGYQPGEADGIYGPMTESAVRAFQERNDLEVDGVVGPLTWAALFDPDTR